MSPSNGSHMSLLGLCALIRPSHDSDGLNTLQRDPAISQS